MEFLQDKAYRQAKKKIIEAAKLKYRTQLNLSEMGLTELPQEIGRATNVNNVLLGSFRWSKQRNQLSELPEALGKLTQLQSLDLSNNKLSILPEWFANLTQLKSLDLSGNPLVIFPKIIEKLPARETLHLRQCYALFSIKSKPSTFREISRITNLSLLDLSITTRFHITTRLQ